MRARKNRESFRSEKFFISITDRKPELYLKQGEIADGKS